MKGFRPGLVGVTVPTGASLPTGFNKRTLIANTAPFRITRRLPEGEGTSPVWQNTDLTPLAEVPPDALSGRVPDQTMTILSDPTQRDTVRQKFHTPANPLKKEDGHEEMRPTDNVLVGLKERLYQSMIADVMASEMDQQRRAAKLQAIATARLQNLDQCVTAEVTDQFIQDFRDWLVKKGRCVDHYRAGWWPDDGTGTETPQKALPKFIASGGTLNGHPSVKHYVERFIVSRADFERDMVLMRAQVKSGAFRNWDINQFWKYYKYVVRGLVPDDSILNDPDVMLPTEDNSLTVQSQNTQTLADMMAPVVTSLSQLSGQIGEYQQKIQEQNKLLMQIVANQVAAQSVPPSPPPPAAAPPPPPAEAPSALSSSAPMPAATVQPADQEDDDEDYGDDEPDLMSTEPLPADATVQPAGTTGTPTKPDLMSDDIPIPPSTLPPTPPQSPPPSYQDSPKPEYFTPPSTSPPDTPPASRRDTMYDSPDDPLQTPPPESRVAESPGGAPPAVPAALSDLQQTVPPPASPIGVAPEIPADLPLDMDVEQLDPSRLSEWSHKARVWSREAGEATRASVQRVNDIKELQEWSREGGEDLEAQLRAEAKTLGALASKRNKVFEFTLKLQKAMQKHERRVLFTGDDTVHPIPSRAAQAALPESPVLSTPPSQVKAKPKKH